MSPEELYQRLILRGYKSKIRREEVVLEVCRFCGNPKWNLELNAPRGVFYAWCCNAGGRLDALLSEWFGESIQLEVRSDRGLKNQRASAAPGAIPRIPAYEHPVAAGYLQRRGISADLARDYELTICAQAHFLQHRILVPIKDFWTGVTIGYSGRSFINAQPKYLTTLTTKIVAGYRQRANRTLCILVEGFFDGIAIHHAGFQAAVLGGIANRQLLEFVARIYRTIPLAIMLDGDAKEKAQRLQASLIPIHPIPIIPLPMNWDPGVLQPLVVKLLVQTHVGQDYALP